MGANTNISWTDATWSPVTGCTPVSEGCANCYAARYAKRHLGDFAPGPWQVISAKDKYRELRMFSEVRCHPDRLEVPLHWKTPRRIFVCSMGDLFHEQVSAQFQEQVFRTMISAPQHTFQILTKRPEVMLRRVPIIMNRILGFPESWTMPKNIWLGVTAENQARADERIPLLLKTPAAVRFVSIEPMLGPINLFGDGSDAQDWTCNGPDCKQACINWIICGGESGPGARPMKIEWARSLREQCQAAGVPFHLKQLGEWVSSGIKPDRAGTEQLGDFCFAADIGKLYATKLQKQPGKYHMMPDGEIMVRVGKKKAGRLLDGREWLEFPENSQNSKQN